MTSRAGVTLRAAPAHEEEDMERHTVEVSFEAEEVSSVTDEHTTTLYRRPDNTYLVHLDGRKVGDNAVLETGAYPRGLSEHDIRVMWPGLLEAQEHQ
jgi:hypothetical protein